MSLLYFEKQYEFFRVFYSEKQFQKSGIKTGKNLAGETLKYTQEYNMDECLGDQELDHKSLYEDSKFVGIICKIINHDDIKHAQEFEQNFYYSDKPFDRVTDYGAFRITDSDYDHDYINMDDDCNY